MKINRRDFVKAMVAGIVTLHPIAQSIGGISGELYGRSPAASALADVGTINSEFIDLYSREVEKLLLQRAHMIIDPPVIRSRTGQVSMMPMGELPTYFRSKSE